MNVPVTAEVLPMRDIVLYGFHKGSSDLLLTLSFVSQLLLTGSHSEVFQPHYVWLRNIQLSLLAALYASPNGNTSLCIRGGDPFQLPFSILFRLSGGCQGI